MGLHRIPPSILCQKVLHGNFSYPPYNSHYLLLSLINFLSQIVLPPEHVKPSIFRHYNEWVVDGSESTSEKPQNCVKRLETTKASIYQCEEKLADVFLSPLPPSLLRFCCQQPCRRVTSVAHCQKFLIRSYVVFANNPL